MQQNCGIFDQCEEYARMLHMILLRAHFSQNVKYWYKISANPHTFIDMNPLSKNSGSAPEFIFISRLCYCFLLLAWAMERVGRFPLQSGVCACSDECTFLSQDRTAFAYWPRGYKSFSCSRHRPLTLFV